MKPNRLPVKLKLFNALLLINLLLLSTGLFAQQGVVAPSKSELPVNEQPEGAAKSTLQPLLPGTTIATNDEILVSPAEQDDERNNNQYPQVQPDYSFNQHENSKYAVYVPNKVTNNMADSQLKSQGGQITIETNQLNVFPNPFVNDAEIRFMIARDSEVSLYLYDMLGKKVKVLFHQEHRDAGSYNLTLDGSRLSKGIYYIYLEVNGKTMVKKIIKAR